MLMLPLKLLTYKIMKRKKKAKSIATYDFSTFYTTLHHDKLIKRLRNVIDFVFKGGNGTHIKRQDGIQGTLLRRLLNAMARKEYINFLQFFCFRKGNGLNLNFWETIDSYEPAAQ